MADSKTGAGGEDAPKYLTIEDLDKTLDEKLNKAITSRMSQAEKAAEKARTQRAKEYAEARKAELDEFGKNLFGQFDERLKPFSSLLKPPAGAGNGGGQSAQGSTSGGPPDINLDDLPAFKALREQNEKLAKQAELLQKQQAQLAKEREQEAKEKAQLQEQTRRESLRTATLRALNAAGVKDQEAAEDALDVLLARGLVRYGEDERKDVVLFWKSATDLPQDLTAGIGAWVKEPRQAKYLPPKVTGGSGGGPGGGPIIPPRRPQQNGGGQQRVGFDDLLSEALKNPFPQNPNDGG